MWKILIRHVLIIFKVFQQLQMTGVFELIWHVIILMNLMQLFAENVNFFDIHYAFQVFDKLLNDLITQQ